jgi:hypothetical protein
MEVFASEEKHSGKSLLESRLSPSRFLSFASFGSYDLLQFRNVRNLDAVDSGRDFPGILLWDDDSRESELHCLRDTTVEHEDIFHDSCE